MSANLPVKNGARQISSRYLDRRKLFVDRDHTMQTARTVQELIAKDDKEELRAFLHAQYPPDLSDVMFFLDDPRDKAVFDLLDSTEAAEVLDEADSCTREFLVQNIAPERLAKIIEVLPADEATDVLEAAKPVQIEPVLSLIPPDHARLVRELLVYGSETAGGIMSKGFVTVPETATVGDSLRAFAQDTKAEPIPFLYVLDQTKALVGVLDVRELLASKPEDGVRSHAAPPFVTVHPEMGQAQVAKIFSRYDLIALPVVAAATSILLGVITSDDVIDVIEHENTESQLRMAGSDAEELEKRSPTHIAFLRLPWIMATMFIELFAGLVIHFFDATLAHVILLASFMPIISAISGNTGLQSATIIVRGLSTGQIRVLDWQRALYRQLRTTLILGLVTGLTLGVIGAIWYGKWTFGLVVSIGMFCAVNIAGIVGTVVPLTSKRLGFDPAITSGPFETAFQDVVGISIFLGLATFLIRFLL